MGLAIARSHDGGGLASMLRALVDVEGTASHRHAIALDRNDAPMRDVVDALHILCMLHGHHPCIIDHAKDHTAGPAATEWLAETASGFSAERQRLALLVAAAGPLPSTPGQAKSEAAVTGQSHALAILAQSDRTGCALGAAVALTLDWPAIRRFTDRAAHRMGIDPVHSMLPDPIETAQVVETFATALATERATLFGAQQLLSQHRRFWGLLEARAAARLG